MKNKERRKERKREKRKRKRERKRERERENKRETGDFKNFFSTKVIISLFRNVGVMCILRSSNYIGCQSEGRMWQSLHWMQRY